LREQRRGARSRAGRRVNVHLGGKTVLEPIPVANAGVGDELAVARIVDHLMDIDGDAAVGVSGRALQFDLARDRGELPVSVVANRARPTTRLPPWRLCQPTSGCIRLRTFQAFQNLHDLPWFVPRATLNRGPAPFAEQVLDRRAQVGDAVR
jgi:hypothetical protein